MTSKKPEEPRLDQATLAEFRRGLAEFNSGKFFECHDTLEEIWRGTRGPTRDFFQGLIQIAVAFYHLDNGNLPGWESQLDKGLKNLEPYGDSFAGIDLAGLRRELHRWMERVRTGNSLRADLEDLPKFSY